MTAAKTETAPGLAIFRRRDAAPLDSVMSYEPPSEVAAAGASAANAAGYGHGHKVQVLFAGAGMSLTHVWFKSGFPLARHSHDCDCVYYVVAGSLTLGAETLGPGDGFFVGKDVPYAYTPGPSGVEVLEFRSAEAFNFKLLADNPAFWRRALETTQSRRAGWETEPPPALAAP